MGQCKHHFRLEMKIGTTIGQPRYLASPKLVVIGCRVRHITPSTFIDSRGEVVSHEAKRRGRHSLEDWPRGKCARRQKLRALNHPQRTLRQIWGQAAFTSSTCP